MLNYDVLPMQKIHQIIFLTFPLFVIHTLEEYVTMYANILSLPKNPENLTPPQSEFVIFELLVWIFLGILIILIKIKKLPRLLLAGPAFLYIFQFEHIYHAIKLHAYYAGLISGVMLFVLGIIFWREIITLSFLKTSAKKKR